MKDLVVGVVNDEIEKDVLNLKLKHRHTLIKNMFGKRKLAFILRFSLSIVIILEFLYDYYLLALMNGLMRHKLELEHISQLLFGMVLTFLFWSDITLLIEELIMMIPIDTIFLSYFTFTFLIFKKKAIKGIDKKLSIRIIFTPTNMMRLFD